MTKFGIISLSILTFLIFLCVSNIIYIETLKDKNNREFKVRQDSAQRVQDSITYYDNYNQFINE